MKSVQVSTKSVQSSHCMNDILIETNRLLLCRFTPADGADFSEILTNPEVCYFEPYQPFTHEKALAEAEKLSHDDSFFAVVLKDSGKLIGKLYLHDEEFFGTYELGYTFHQSYWGKGYATESVKALMHYVFTEMNVRRIFSEADVRNVRSCRVLEKLGMRKEGMFLQSASFQSSPDGTPIYSDYCSYALLRSEYLGN